MTNSLYRSGALLTLLAVFAALALYNFSFALYFALGALLGAFTLRLFHSHAAAPPRDDEAQAGEMLREETPLPASALLEATMESMREGVLVVDRSMRVVAANRAAQSLFGSSQGTVAMRRLTELTRNPAIHQAFTSALEQDARAEVKVEATGQERRTFDIRVAPLHRRAATGEAHAAGADSEPQNTPQHTEVQGAVGVFFDITRLERLERVRQEFLSNVSHELRTPLTAILTFVETLESGAMDDAENNRRFLNIIRRNAARMQNLIHDILELSAIEAGTVQVEPAPLELHHVITDVFTALAARAAERRIELHNEVSPDAIVTGDRNRLEQMLTNLVDNAVKFNRDGGAITVRHARDAARGRDLISVHDTGEGIPPEHIERIFERFYRIDRARSRALGGTGLGLAIVKHLARAHGGEARVSSDTTGSTFTLELPMKQSGK